MNAMKEGTIGITAPDFGTGQQLWLEETSTLKAVAKDKTTTLVMQTKGEDMVEEEDE